MTTERSDSIVCSCGTVLGRWVGPRHARIARITTHGRETICLPISIQCEHCGVVWQAPVSSPGPLERIEVKSA
jgi:hypothetical protein